MIARLASAATLATMIAACQPIDMGAPGGQTPGTLPAAVQGSWGLTAGDCRPGAADAKGLMEVGPSTLKFYESRATLDRVVEADASRVVADFTFTGEGQTWKRQMILDAQDGGSTLVRRDYGDGAMPGALKYTTCG